MMPDNYQIPDAPDSGRMDASYLRTCLGLRTVPGESPPELPDAVRQAHYDMARSLSILGATGPGGMTPTQLATVVALSLRARSKKALPVEEPPQPSFLEDVVSGQKVVVHWQLKDQAAHFIEQDGTRVKLLVKGDEIRFRPDLVRHAKQGEFPDIPDNINQTVGA